MLYFEKNRKEKKYINTNSKVEIDSNIFLLS